MTGSPSVIALHSKADMHCKTQLEIFKNLENSQLRSKDRTFNYYQKIASGRNAPGCVTKLCTVTNLPNCPRRVCGLCVGPSLYDRSAPRLTVFSDTTLHKEFYSYGYIFRWPLLWLYASIPIITFNICFLNEHCKDLTSSINPIYHRSTGSPCFRHRNSTSIRAPVHPLTSCGPFVLATAYAIFRQRFVLLNP